MAIEDFYVEITKRVPTHSTSNKGEPIKTYTESTIKGYYNGPPAGNPQLIGGKWTVKHQTKLLCNDSTIKHDDEVIIDSEIWRCIGPCADGGNKGHHYEILIERIKNVD